MLSIHTYSLTTSGGTLLRDVVLKPSGEVGRFPHPDTSRHAGVLLSRKFTERQLFLQVKP